MKLKKLGLIVVMFVILYIPTSFIYTRFYFDTYEMDGYLLKNQDIVYVFKDLLVEDDMKKIGKPIGISFHGKRTFLNTIFPCWIREFKNDKEHNEVYVKGLMDEGRVYEKVTK